MQSVDERIAVLVIDDDDEGRELLADALRRAGYAVEIACNGHEGLNILERALPSLILLDVHMPIMDGLHFREAQRQDARWIAIPTIVMTGDSAIDPLLDVAVADTLRKPVRLDELFAVVAQHCGAR